VVFFLRNRMKSSLTETVRNSTRTIDYVAAVSDP